MPATQFVCGNAICKRPVKLGDGVEPSWPVRHECGAWLYPKDLLELRTAKDEALYPDPAPLMHLLGGKLADTDSSDFRPAPAPPPPSPAVQALLTPRPRSNRRAWLAAAALALIALAAAIIALR